VKMQKKYIILLAKKHLTMDEPKAMTVHAESGKYAISKTRI